MTFTGMSTRGHLTRQSYKQASEDSWVIPKRTDTNLLGPDLPRLDGVTWTTQTRSWYREVRRSDIASIYTDAEWQMVLSTALVHNAIWSGNLPMRERQTFQTELRQQLSALLLTPEARKKNKVVFVDPDPLEEAFNRPAAKKQDLKAMFAGEAVIDQ